MSRVNQILARCDSYLGKPVRAAGYLGECAGYECHLYHDKAVFAADVDAWNAAMEAQRKFRRNGEKPEDLKLLSAAMDRTVAQRYIGIGGEQKFDRKAAPLQHHYVVITGRMDDHSCDGVGGTDRVTGIHPTDIRAWLPSEGAPTNTH